LFQGQSGGKLSPLEGGAGGRAAGEERPAVPRGGLSCLASHTLDEDREPLFKSPEKKLPAMLSPSGRSISDIFGKVRKIVPLAWIPSLASCTNGCIYFPN
jgi:hypothetical protein